jgi:hypothetical protein
MPSTTNLEEEKIVDALGNDGNASMPKQVNRPNPWRKMMMIMMTFIKTPINALLIRQILNEKKNILIADTLSQNIVFVPLYTNYITDFGSTPKERPPCMISRLLTPPLAGKIRLCLL